MKQQAHFYGFEMLPTYVMLGREQLREALHLLQLFKTCEDRPHVLDDHLVNRTIKLSTDQNEMTWVPIEQCRKWRDQSPSKEQLEDIVKVENSFNDLHATNEKILVLADQLKQGTIDSIISKSDIEAGLDFLLNNSQLLTPSNQTKEETELVTEAAMAGLKSLYVLKKLFKLLTTSIPSFIDYQLSCFWGPDMLQHLENLAEDETEVYEDIIDKLFEPWSLCYFPFGETDGGIYQSLLGQKLQEDGLLPEMLPTVTFLQGIDAAHYSFYMLVEKRDVDIVVLQDILLDQIHVIHDIMLPQQITKGDIIYAKVIPYKTVHFIFGMFPMALNSQHLKQILDMKTALKQAGLLTKQALRFQENDRLRFQYFEMAFLNES